MHEQVHLVVDLKFLINVGNMGADGVDADVELLRDLFILHAGGQVVDDPPLLLGQGVVGVIQILGQVLGR